MNRNTFLAAMLAGLIAAPVMATRDLVAAPEVSTSQKGSLLWWSDVEVKFDENENLVMDTFLELTNDSNDPVYVQLYFVNGDPPLAEERSGAVPFELLERAHPGWNFVDVQIFLTPNKPTYWSAATGNNFNADSLQVPPFGNLDADPNPLPPDHMGTGRPDPDNHLLGLTNRTVRGFVVGWAVAIAGQETTHNHLTGSAMKIDYQLTAAWEYDAFAYKRLAATAGDGVIMMDGVEYDRSPARLQLDFYSVPTEIFSGPLGPSALILDTDLTIHPTQADFRATGDGPVTTYVEVNVWNQNEIRFSGAARCVSCWDQTLLGDFMGLGILAGNHFLRDNIGTDKGKARLTGIGGVWCPNPFQDHDELTDDDHVLATEEPILGVAVKIMSVQVPERGENDDEFMYAGSPLTLQGTDDTAEILWDIIDAARELETEEMERINRARQEMGLSPVPSTKTERTIGTRN